MLYNIGLISAMHQHELAIGVHMSPPSGTSLPLPTLSHLSRASLRRPWFNSWVGKICGSRDRLLTPVFLGFPYGSAGKESACNVGHLGSIPGLGRSPREGKGYLRQHSGLESSMDCIVHGVTKSWTRPSDFPFQVVIVLLFFQFCSL